MGDVSKMNTSNVKVIGRCCNKKGKSIVTYDGSPSENYATILCKDHYGKEPFNKNILKVTSLEEI